MKDKKHTPDLMSQVLGQRQPAGKPIKSESPAADESSEMKITPLRLPAVWKEALKKHFKEKGQDLSNGIRGILAEYMDREGLK